MPLIGVVLALAVAAAPQQTVDLKYKSFVGRAWSGGYCFSGYRGYLGESEGESVSAPKGAVNAKSFYMSKSADDYSSRKPISGVIAQSSAKVKGYDLLWVDWNEDGAYGAAERATRTFAAKGLAIYTPSDKLKIEGSRGPYRYVANESTVSLEPAGYFEGTAKLGGRSVKLGVVDANLDGLVGNSGREYGATDFMLVDYNGNGKLDGPAGDIQYMQYPGESAPFRGEVLMPDKAFYSIRVSPSGRKLVLARKPQGTGAIAVKGATIASASVLDAEGGQIATRPLGGVCPVPVGTYRDADVYVVKNGWVCNLNLSRLNIVVAAGKTVYLASASPDKLALTVQKTGDQYEFSVDAKTAKGGDVSGVYKPSGENPDPPTLSIRNAKGKVVKGLAFEYG
jgi:hypothetical protein